MQTQREKILIIGAGLVGSLLSIYLARMGYAVAVYDKHSDLSAFSTTAGKSSLNLTLCERGLRVLDEVGVGDHVRRITTPVYGRMIHSAHGDMTFQHYGPNQQALYSILRGDLNKVLVDFAREHHPIEFYFDQKCLDLALATNTATFKHLPTGAVSTVTADRIFGADGAFSVVRSHLQRVDRFNYSQQYMEYGYRELTIPATERTGWLTDQNVIHFWPRVDYMLMGFANVDGSFTLSLHMPLQGEHSFETLRTKDDVLAFFAHSFPDVLPYVCNLSDELFTRTNNSLLTIRCSPWSFQDKVALIGDSAHAIVPYYGQGANAGFEDCAVLSRCIERFGNDWTTVFREYERLRRPNTDAIADLALRNFVELRALVAEPKFLLRKEIEHRVSTRYPDKYMTLYSMIAFSSMPYVEALRIDQIQRMFIDQIMTMPGIDQCSALEVDELIDDLIQHWSVLPEHQGIEAF